jgi:hypothetical protein
LPPSRRRCRRRSSCGTISTENQGRPTGRPFFTLGKLRLIRCGTVCSGRKGPLRKSPCSAPATLYSSAASRSNASVSSAMPARFTKAEPNVSRSAALIRAGPSFPSPAWAVCSSYVHGLPGADSSSGKRADSSKEKRPRSPWHPLVFLRRRSHITSQFDTLPSTIARDAERIEKAASFRGFSYLTLRESASTNRALSGRR